MQQFDFRSNLKKSKTNENLADLKFDSDHENDIIVDPELEQKLKMIRAKIEPGSLEDNSELTHVTSLDSNSTLGMIT